MAAGPVRARVLTLNLWQEQGPWTERIEWTCAQLGHLGPDIICLQEVRQVEGKIPNQAATLAVALGMEHVYSTAQPWGGGDEGLAILSRFPIVGQAEQELPYTEGRSRRICLGAEIELPCGRTWVFTTHLAFRLEDGLLRERQILAAERFIHSKRPAAEHAMVFCGDFNATPESDEIRFLKGLVTLDGRRSYFQDAFEVCNPGVDGHTWTHENPYTEQLHWFPSRRLDYVFVTPMRRSGVGRIVSCRIVCQDPNSRGVYCTDHYGVFSEITFGA